MHGNGRSLIEEIVYHCVIAVQEILSNSATGPRPLLAEPTHP